jgi:hypothetical protein
MRIETWADTKESAEQELSSRWRFCKSARQHIEGEWTKCEHAVFSCDGVNSFSPALEFKLGAADGDATDSPERISANYILRNVRLLHSQLALNPPLVTPRPLTSDNENRKRADAAERIGRFGLKKYDLADTTDLVSLGCLIHGTGWGTTMWNPELGEPIDFDEESGVVKMSGDFEYVQKSVWNFYPDADCRRAKDLKYYFEDSYIPYVEALSKYRDVEGIEDLLKKHRLKEVKRKDANISMAAGSQSIIPISQYDVVRVVQYWETGTPQNGLKGRMCWCLVCSDDQLKLLDEKVGPNPHAFSRPLRAKEDVNAKRPLVARLPCKIFTDIDVPNTLWGKSVVAYALKLQDVMNKMDSVTLDIIKAHGIARLILDDGCEMSSESITNSTWDIVRIKREGNAAAPQFMPPLPLPEAVPNFRAGVKVGIDDMFGVNESMMGQMGRETANVTMQMATQNGNMIRKRLFSKYALFVESIYKDMLDVFRMKWTTPQTISVLGKEKAFETADFQGADIDGGFDFVTDYGASLSVDPLTRRQEMMTYLPFFEKAGISPKTILKHMRLNDIETLFDMAQLGTDRQREIFDTMYATGKYIPPHDMRDHKSMLEFGYNFIMSAEFKGWPQEVQDMVEQHMREREQLAKNIAAGDIESPGAATVPAPEPQQPQLQTPQGLGDLLQM